MFREKFFDEDAELKWSHKARYSNAALSEAQVAKRYKFAQDVQKIPRTSRWYYHNVVWTDLCNSILPRTEQKATEQALARKGARGWGSKG